jgi:hypothetical protein
LANAPCRRWNWPRMSDRPTCALLVCPAQHGHSKNTERFEPQPKKAASALAHVKCRVGRSGRVSDDARHPKYARLATAIQRLDVKAGQLEELIGTEEMREYQIQGAAALLFVVMREDARSAGRAVEREAIRKDLNAVKGARETTLEMYCGLVDADVWGRVSFEHRHALTKHGFPKKQNPFRPIVPPT